MRELTDAEHDQFRTKYPEIWLACVGRPKVVTATPLILSLMVYDGAANRVVPQHVRGFALDLESAEITDLMPIPETAA